MTEELKPVRCGCGGEATLETAPFMNLDDLWKVDDCQYLVHCQRCGIGTRIYNSKEEAITAWNSAMGSVEKSSTVERTAKVEGNRCTACDNYIRPCMKYCDHCGARLEWE